MDSPNGDKDFYQKLMDDFPFDPDIEYKHSIALIAHTFIVSIVLIVLWNVL